MDKEISQIREGLLEIEIEAERLLVAKQDLVGNDKKRNENREALTALRKQARSVKRCVSDPCERIMKELEGNSPKVMKVCRTCENCDSRENTWMAFPGGDIFACLPFHAVHVNLEKDEEQLELTAKRLNSYLKEKSLLLSEKGALSGRLSPHLLKSIVTLKDNS